MIRELENAFGELDYGEHGIDNVWAPCTYGKDLYYDASKIETFYTEYRANFGNSVEYYGGVSLRVPYLGVHGVSGAGKTWSLKHLMELESSWNESAVCLGITLNGDEMSFRELKGIDDVAQVAWRFLYNFGRSEFPDFEKFMRDVMSRFSNANNLTIADALEILCLKCGWAELGDEMINMDDGGWVKKREMARCRNIMIFVDDLDKCESWKGVISDLNRAKTQFLMRNKQCKVLCVLSTISPYEVKEYAGKREMSQLVLQALPHDSSL